MEQFVEFQGPVFLLLEGEVEEVVALVGVEEVAEGEVADQMIMGKEDIMNFLI
jgi:hypothetical protein